MRILIDLTPLRNSLPFARLWLAGVLVSVSAQMMQMGVAWALYNQTGSSLVVGGLGLAIGVPTVAFGLLGGALTDTRRPRMLGIIGVSGQLGATVALLAITFFVGFSPAPTYAAVICQSAFGAMTSPTRRPYIRHLIAPSSIPAAMSLYMLSMNFGQILGPILGGVLLSRNTVATLFAIHALCLVMYLVSVVMLPDIPPASHERQTIFAVGEGLRLAWRIRDIRVVLLVDIIATLFALPLALLPALNQEIFKGDAVSYGLLLGALSSGGALGTLFSGWIGRVRHPVKLVVLLTLVWCCGIAALAVGSLFFVALVALFLMGISDAWSVITQQIVTQTSAPDSALGRVGSIQSIVGMAGPQLGNFRAGALGSTLGTRPAIMVGSTMAIILIICFYGISVKKR